MRFRRLQRNSFLLALLGGWAIAACQAPITTPTASTVSPTLVPAPLSPTVTAAPSVAPDVLIQPDQVNQPIVIQLGQTMAILPPDLSSKWQVEFDPDLLESETPPEQMQTPGEAGWRFKAVATGQGQIVLTSIVTCNQPQPCPLMPRRIELIIEVK